MWTHRLCVAHEKKENGHVDHRALRAGRHQEREHLTRCDRSFLFALADQRGEISPVISPKEESPAEIEPGEGVRRGIL